MSGGAGSSGILLLLIPIYSPLQGRCAGESIAADGLVGQRRGPRFVYTGGSRGQLLGQTQVVDELGYTTA